MISMTDPSTFLRLVRRSAVLAVGLVLALPALFCLGSLGFALVRRPAEVRLSA